MKLKSFTAVASRFPQTIRRSMPVLIGASLFASGLLFRLPAQGAALLFKDDSKGVIFLISKFIYRGQALTPKIAHDSTLEITSLWNEAGGKIQYRGKKYRMKFIFSYVLDSQQRYFDSGSCAENFVSVENPARHGDRSFYYLGGRSGTFYTSDDLGRSTTTAHEYGHGLGMDHDDLDQLSAKTPGIMFARGTLVPKKFQWNPSSDPGTPGGSIKPHHRRVRAEDLKKLALDSVNFSGQLGCLGQGSPTWVRYGRVVFPEPVLDSGAILHEHVESPDVNEERASEAHDH